MFKHILLPTDGSELSERALQTGIELAKTIGAKVTGLYALESYPLTFYGEYVPADSNSSGVKASAGTYSP
jgi:nucleotide-binding universal stress UspA family protein